MNKVIVVSYTDEDYDSYLEVYAYSPAIIEKLISESKNYLNEEGFYLSSFEDWKNWNDLDGDWAEDNTPVCCKTGCGDPAELNWESLESIERTHGELMITDEYNITIHICVKDVTVPTFVENFDEVEAE